jgi:hypothetical protein
MAIANLFGIIFARYVVLYLSDKVLGLLLGPERRPIIRPQHQNHHTMMKDLRLTALSTLLASATAMAQVPNGSFEQWTDFGTYSDPDGWTSLNILTTSLGGALSCEEVTPGASGSKAVKVTTRNVPGLGVLPGLLLSGSPDAEVDGFPYTSRPEALNGQWKASLGTGDQANIVVTLSKWNNVLGEREVIGAGVVATGININSWTAFSAAIVYSSSENPDTASIAIISSSGSGVDGSALWVDALSFGSGVGIEEAYTGLVELYPVPAVDVLNLVTERPMQVVELWSADGRLLTAERPLADRIVMDMQGLPGGSYVVVARMADGTVLRRTVVK